MTAKDLVVRHEGLRLNVYCDKCGLTVRLAGRYWGCECQGKGVEPGRMTIGYGRNLEVEGIWKGEALGMLGNDLGEAVVKLATFKWWPTLDDVRRAVCIDMVYNLGFAGFQEFEDFIRELSFGHWVAARVALIDSDAANKEIERYRELGAMVETGEWPIQEAA